VQKLQKIPPEAGFKPTSLARNLYISKKYYSYFEANVKDESAITTLVFCLFSD
jgi:hypothetical protein